MSTALAADDHEEEELSSRARVWTSALNKQPAFARQTGDQSAPNASDAVLPRRPPFSVDERDLPQAVEPGAEGEAPLSLRARTSLDMEENSFVLRPMLSSHAVPGRSTPPGKRLKSKKNRSPHSPARARGPHAESQERGKASDAQAKLERPLSVRITDRLYGRRERPVALVAGGSFPERKRSTRSRSSMDGGPSELNQSRGDRSSGPNLAPVHAQAHDDDGDGNTLTRTDSLLSRARRALSTGTTSRAPHPLIQQPRRREPGRRPRSLDDSFYQTGGRALDVEPLDIDRETDAPEPTTEPQPQRDRNPRQSTLAGGSRPKSSQRPRHGPRRSYVDLDPIRRNAGGSSASGRGRSSGSGIRSLQQRIRDLEDEVAAATAEGARMSSLITALLEENAATKNAVPILEDVIRKSRHHFESKERALRLTITTMDTDLALAIKTRNEALRAVAHYSGRPVSLGSQRFNSGGAVGGIPSAGSESRKRTSSWGSLEGSTAARRLRELEELSGPLSGTGSGPESSTTDGLADVDSPLD